MPRAERLTRHDPMPPPAHTSMAGSGRPCAGEGGVTPSAWWPRTRSAVSAMGSGGCCGPRSAIRPCSPRPMIRGGCSIASRMFNQIPVGKGQGSAVLRLVSANWALALLLITAGVPALAAELTFDIKIERGRVPDTMRLIRVNKGDVVKLRLTSDQSIVLHLHGYDN